MPISLPAFSRRRFLGQSLAAILGSRAAAQALSDSESWVLFSDSHIAADRTLISRGINMATNLERCVKEALAWQAKPSAMILCGDCAYNHGEAGDYETFGALVRPLREAGLPVHLLMGNHDDREPFAAVLGKDEKMPAPVEQKHVGLVQGRTANWFLLDSLDKVNSTPGVLGDTQRAWLEKSLDAHADKPAIVMVHHNVALPHPKAGLQDSEELLAILRPRKHVKACVYGHTHAWDMHHDESGLHFINLPPTGYVFKEPLPSGWVRATIGADSMKLELRCLDEKNPKHGEVKELPWRVQNGSAKHAKRREI